VIPNTQSHCEIDVATLGHHHPVRAFATYWRERELAGKVPARSSINPGEITSILPWMLVLEILRFETATEYRYRLAGTGCTEIFGVDYTGKMLGECMTQEGYEIRRQEFARVLENRQPIISTTTLPIKSREFMIVHRGVFPIRASGEEIDQLFVIVAPATAISASPGLAHTAS
jgi:hypothetical protein